MLIRRQIVGAYFGTLRMRLVAGRVLSDSDIGSNNAVVGAAVVGRLWPGTQPWTALTKAIELTGGSTLRIVGVVGDTRDRQEATAQPCLYVPASASVKTLAVIARTRGSSAADIAAMRLAVKTAIGGNPPVPIHWISDRLDPWLRDPRLYAELFGSFGLIAAFLAGVGLFAVTIADVRARRFEMGVRTALGASRSAIVALIVSQAVRPALVGTAIGAAVAFFSAPALQPLLHVVKARSMAAYAIVGCLIVLVAAMAAFGPAIRASQTDPVSVLKQD